jgi:hypothetical protein
MISTDSVEKLVENPLVSVSKLLRINTYGNLHS